MVLIRFTVLGVLLLLGGCQYVGLQSSQLSGIISVFNTDSEEQPEFTWSLQYGGYSAAVQPMSLETSTTFVNELDTIAFDGGSITKVSGLSSFTPAWEIQDTGRVRANGPVHLWPSPPHSSPTQLDRTTQRGLPPCRRRRVHPRVHCPRPPRELCLLLQRPALLAAH